ncbi:MAG: DUF1592 domain-containing protein [Polyangiaceae bacterium]|nr:DUF1592 domain-containing protein [Polyangiaceae bacterium]
MTPDGTNGTPGSGGSGALGTGGAGNTGGATPGTGAQPAVIIPAGSPGPTALRRLSNDEYRATVQDLLGLAAPPADPLIPESRQLGYENFSEVLTVPPVLGSQYATMAVRLAAEADISALAPCAAPAMEAECADAFIDRFGKQVHRQPVTAQEHAAYRVVYDLTRTTDTYEIGIRRLLEAMLQSPALLYRMEYGAGAAERTLTPYEVASELSYLFLGSMPDAALMEAADTNSLSTPAQIEAQARRLLGLPRARQSVGKFLEQWFMVSTLPQLVKDPGLFPDFEKTQKAAMGASTDRFIESVVWEGDGTVKTLLSAPFAFVNSSLASVYGVPDPGQGDTLVQVDVSAMGRSGMLTLPSLLAVQAKENESDPVGRGKFVRTRMFCQALPPPPPNVKIDPPPSNPNLTTRERFAAHSADAACSGCHSLMDPIGFGLEVYDGIGAYRTSENGLAVDASGDLTGTDVDGKFTGGVELASRLAMSASVRQCAAINAARFAYGRKEIATDTQLAATLDMKLGVSGMDVRELLVALTQSASFTTRTFVP